MTNPTDLPLSAATLALIDDARSESVRRRHEYIGTEHLVLALSQQVGDAALLPALAIEPQRVYHLLSDTIKQGRDAPNPDIERPFTSRTKQAFSFAAESARELGHAEVDVSHLLVGLLRERMNIGAQVLADSGLTEERAYEYARESGAHGEA